MALFPKLARSPQALKFLVILGSGRQGRHSEIAAKYILGQLRARPHITTEFVDVRDFAFPPDQYGTDMKKLFPKYIDAVRSADAVIIVTPEYNHSFPGTLKTLLDIAYPEYMHKAAGMVGVSSGPWGGVRVIEALTPVLKDLGLLVSQYGLNMPHIETAFNIDATPTDKGYVHRTAKFIDEVQWLAEALRWGRANLSE